MAVGLDGNRGYCRRAVYNPGHAPEILLFYCSLGSFVVVLTLAGFLVILVFFAGFVFTEVFFVVVLVDFVLLTGSSGVTFVETSSIISSNSSITLCLNLILGSVPSMSRDILFLCL